MPWLTDILVKTSLTLSRTPLGKILAEVLEEYYDLRISLAESNWRGRILPRSYLLIADQRITFITATFSMLAKMAMADRTLKNSEANTVNDFIEKRLKLSKKDGRFAREVFQTALGSDASFSDFARQYHNQFSEQEGMLENMIEILRLVAIADGDLNPDENKIIGDALRLFKLPPSVLRSIDKRRINVLSRVEEFNALRNKLRVSLEAELKEEPGNFRRFSSQKKEQSTKTSARNEQISVQQALDILGATNKDSITEIKRKYRKLALKHHPDKLQAQGMPKAFGQISATRFREIQAAYDLVIEYRSQ